jgi:CRISPR system Cascade subunit CasB
MENMDQKPAKPEHVIQAWWKHWTGKPEEHEASRKGELAALRRCKNLEEIFFTPQYQNLYHQAAAAGWDNQEAMAAIAGILAHVKNDPKPEAKTVAEHFARIREGGDSPIVSEARFIRLVKLKTHAELFPALLRLIQLADKSAPLPDLIRGVYWWSDKTRRNWTFKYYEKLPEKEGKK